ncbi:AB hydrolase-1 domain-containing protein [Aphelenchoides bicaudatus]|nr:AB hydrolase-1 domain-containing protein [Aphelenchoides bicaudatus]
MSFGVLLRRLIFYTLIIFFSTVTALKLLYSWFKKRGNFFYVNDHPKPKALSEFKDGYVQVSEVKLHYVEAGDRNKPLMVFVHGFPSFWWCWRFQLRYFQKDYHVVALDMRGYGESDKPKGYKNYTVQKLSSDLIQFIEHFGKEVNLVAHDWGAVIAWNVALQKPELIHKLIICNVPEPRAFRETIKGNYKQLLSSWYMFMFQTPGLAEAVFSAEDYRMLIFLLRKSVKDPENFTDEDAECYKFAFSGPNGMTAPINYYRAATTILDSPQQATALVKPKTLIIWGALDVALIVEGAHNSLKYCEQAELKILPNASHFVQEDEPQQVNNYMEEFLNSN